MEYSLNDWTEPKVEIIFRDEDKNRILGYIISVGSSFPSDISKHLLIDVMKVNAMLIQMTNDGILVRIVPDQFYPQPLIRCRIAQMWGEGINGYAEFIKRSWFCATEKGYWHYSDKFSGEHRRANAMYLKTYPNIELIARITNEGNLPEMKS